ncbi:MAG: hypothetical protein L6R40_006681 [Gallowayella cf. fulva]|nr:MAG: hypothetical protein L6R40_006681 [Xanthomendoza cf. fulva]
MMFLYNICQEVDGPVTRCRYIDIIFRVVHPHPFRLAGCRRRIGCILQTLPPNPGNDLHRRIDSFPRYLLVGICLLNVIREVALRAPPELTYPNGYSQHAYAAFVIIISTLWLA